MAKVSLDFSGIDRLMKNIQDMGGDVEEAAKEAMVKTHEHVTAKIEQAMQTHKVNKKLVNWDRTGDTKQSLRTEPDVQVSGNLVSVKTGFEWPSAAKYLAFGRGTPREMKASPGLKNAMDSKKLREEILEIQEKALEDYTASILSK